MYLLHVNFPRILLPVSYLVSDVIVPFLRCQAHFHSQFCVFPRTLHCHLGHDKKRKRYTIWSTIKFFNTEHISYIGTSTWVYNPFIFVTPGCTPETVGWHVVFLSLSLIQYTQSIVLCAFSSFFYIIDLYTWCYFSPVFYESIMLSLIKQELYKYVTVHPWSVTETCLNKNTMKSTSRSLE